VGIRISACGAGGEQVVGIAWAVVGAERPVRRRSRWAALGCDWVSAGSGRKAGPSIAGDATYPGPAVAAPLAKALPLICCWSGSAKLNRGSVGQVGLVRPAGGSVGTGRAHMELGADENVIDQVCGHRAGVEHLLLTEELPVLGILKPDQ
jgi:hypothetical protein